MTKAVEPPTGGAPADTPSLEEQFLKASGYVQRVRRGPRAVLRRLDAGPDRVPPQVFWDVVEHCRIRPREEEFWLAVLPLLVRHPHRFDLSPGRALAHAGVSAARVERWLRLSREDAIRAAGRLLTRVENGMDWTRLGPLLRFWTEDARRELARDFFLSPEHRARAATATATESA
jgi:CRISPR type I-E-associated protein CasB/Cse2